MNVVSPNADVRMKGFAQRATVEKALAWIDSAISERPSALVEEVELAGAYQRVLACDVTSRVNVPAFARSMMDGFALSGEASYGATAYNPLTLRVIGTCLPGVAFDHSVNRDEAVQIMTGAPIPIGTDAVLPVEVSDRDGDNLRVLEPVAVGKNVGQVGEDIRKGDVVARVGQVLRPQDLGLFSSIGIGRVVVRRRPRVRIVITGNELVPAGCEPTGFQIADANGPMLNALVMRDGGESIVGDIVRDEPSLIREALFSDADAILFSGGSSVGQEDFVPKLLAEEGELAVHGIAMRPSSPTGMGRLGQRMVFLLPGNPVSCLCAYDFFAGRAIRSMAGYSPDWPYRSVQAQLTRKLVSTVGRVDYARVVVNGNNAEPLAISGASILSSTTRANGFIVIPADSEGFPAGADVTVRLYQ